MMTGCRLLVGIVLFVTYHILTAAEGCLFQYKPKAEERSFPRRASKHPVQHLREKYILILASFFLKDSPRHPSLVVFQSGKVQIEVYYEVLCPDSRYFIRKQLYPAWDKVAEIMDIHFKVSFRGFFSSGVPFCGEQK